MTDQAEGTVADAGQAVQQKLNQAGEAQEQLVQFIHARPICAVLMAAGIGYLLGKITLRPPAEICQTRAPIIDRPCGEPLLEDPKLLARG